MSGGFGIAEAYPAQMLWIALGGVVTVECDGLIADDAGCAVGWGRVDAVGIHIRFGARDEERAGQMQTVKPAEIDVAAIHDIDGASLGEQRISAWTSWSLPSNMDKARDISAQIQQRVHLHRRPGRAEMRPRKHRQAKIDGRQISA